jgi:hypothetical protein
MRRKKGQKRGNKKQTKTKHQKSPKISKAKRKDKEREEEEKEMEGKEEENAEKQKGKEGPCKVCQGTVLDRCSSKGYLNFLHEWYGRGKQTLSQLSVCIFFIFLLIFEGDCKLPRYKHLRKLKNLPPIQVHIRLSQWLPRQLPRTTGILAWPLFGYPPVPKSPNLLRLSS